MTKTTIHPVQAAILKVLSFKPQARFYELNAMGISNDHFTFHTKRLVELGIIVKTENGLYELTNKGKEFANRFDFDSKEITYEKQAKLTVVVIGMKGEGTNAKYLVQQRLKQPYYGYYGFVSGKIKYGETVSEAALRELQEEAGVIGDLTLTGIEHKMDYDSNNRLLDEKYFFIFRVENLKGELKETFDGGRNLWCTKREVTQLPEIFDDVIELLEIVQSDRVEFIERKFNVKRF